MFTRFRRNLTAAVIGLLAFAALAPQVSYSQDFSDYTENKVIDLLLRGQAFTAPATVYVGLSTAACSDSSVGTEVANSNNYSRVAVTSNLTNWQSTQGNTSASTGTGGATQNLAAINFPTPSGSWGTVTHWFLIDSGTWGSGNLLVCKSLTSSQTIGSGNTVSFAIGALTLTVQ
jgi:hypothetical protein